MKKYFIEGRCIYLREVRLSDVSDRYCRWLNDPEVNQYLETRHAKQSLKSIKRYVESKIEKKDEIFLAICLKADGKHIGNIKLGPINPFHRFADVSLFIGEKDCWGMGIATEAISLLAKFAFDELHLNKLAAGCYAGNIGSARAFENAGFRREGLEKSKWFSGGRYVDGILLGLVNPGR